MAIIVDTNITRVHTFTVVVVVVAVVAAAFASRRGSRICRLHVFHVRIDLLFTILQRQTVIIVTPIVT